MSEQPPVSARARTIVQPPAIQPAIVQPPPVQPDDSAAAADSPGFGTPTTPGAGRVLGQAPLVSGTRAPPKMSSLIKTNVSLASCSPGHGSSSGALTEAAIVSVAGGGGEEQSSTSSIKCAEFAFKGSGGRKCGACFVPPGMRLNAQKLQTLTEQHWKLAPPNTMIASDAGTVHPKAFASEKLVALPCFAQIFADARLHGEGVGVADEERDTFALNVVNDVIFTKMATIFAAVLDASAINAKARAIRMPHARTHAHAHAGARAA